MSYHKMQSIYFYVCAFSVLVKIKKWLYSPQLSTRVATPALTGEPRRDSLSAKSLLYDNLVP